MKRLLTAAMLLAATLSAVGCNDIGTSPNSVSGTYYMQRLGGNPVPASLIYNNASDHVEILAGQITLYSDGTYTDYVRVQDTNYGPTTVFDERHDGEWELNGNQVRMYDDYDGSLTVANVSGSRLTIDSFAGYPIVAEYSK